MRVAMTMTMTMTMTIRKIGHDYWPRKAPPNLCRAFAEP